MPPRRSPRTSPCILPKGKSKELTPLVSWSDQDVDVLLDLVLKEKPNESVSKLSLASNMGGSLIFNDS